MKIIGHGIDLVETARIAQMIDKHGQQFLDRCFTPAEQAYSSDSKRRDEHLAARFAAKEAVLKALGTGWRSGIAWTDAEVVRDAMGKPSVRLVGQAAQIAHKMGITEWHLSLSHTHQHAIASAIACG